MSILITGAAGFIGSHLCDRLLSEGHRVVGIDNLSLGRIENISHLLDNSNFVFEAEDILQPGLLEERLTSHDVKTTFHLAANSDIARSHQDPKVDIDNTLNTTIAVLEAMRKSKTREIVFASTSAIYGELSGKVKESDGPLAPISHYGAAKLASEAFISSYVENYGFQSWITRFPNVVGDRATHGAVFDFVNKLKRTPNTLEVLGNGTQEKPYLHVSDLVTAIVMTWQKSFEPNNIYNVGAETRTTVATIAKLVIEASGQQAEIRYTGGDRGWIGDVPKFDYDISKIKSLGWHPNMSSDDAVRRTAIDLWAAQK